MTSVGSVVVGPDGAAVVVVEDVEDDDPDEHAAAKIATVASDAARANRPLERVNMMWFPPHTFYDISILPRKIGRGNSFPQTCTIWPNPPFITLARGPHRDEMSDPELIEATILSRIIPMPGA
jgi:hypothetical protein